MKIVTLKLRDSKELQFVLDLLRRLNVNFEWREEKASPKENIPPEKNAVADLFGSWPSDKSSDDLVKSLLEARAGS